MRMEVNSCSEIAKPDVFRYVNYREFLKDFYLFRKALRSGFSFRRFSQMVGAKSPNYLQLVMKAERNLSVPMAERVGKALNLEPNEASFFRKLVELEHADSEEQRESAQTDLFRIGCRLKAKLLPANHKAVVSTWYHLLVRELVCLPGFEASGEWISNKLRGLISVAEAEKSFSLLQRVGLIRFEGGKYCLSDVAIDTGNTFGESAIIQAHQGTLKTWAAVLPQTDPELREIGSLNIPIDSRKLPEFRERIRAFQDEIVGWLQNETNPDRVVQLGVYLIPITTGAGGLEKTEALNRE